MSIEEIRNVVVLDEHLATAGQPTEDQLRAIASAGYSVVINLDVPDSRFALRNEAALVEDLGMSYHNIAVDFGAPTLADFQRFAQTMDDLQGEKIFIHCAANYRVATFTALYGQLKWGWSHTQADAHIRCLWEPNRVWLEFIATLRQTLNIGTPQHVDQAE